MAGVLHVSSDGAVEFHHASMNTSSLLSATAETCLPALSATGIVKTGRQCSDTSVHNGLTPRG
jgi:hypothetical protein